MFEVLFVIYRVRQVYPIQSDDINSFIHQKLANAVMDEWRRQSIAAEVELTVEGPTAGDPDSWWQD